MKTSGTLDHESSTKSTYLLDNAGKEASSRFPALSSQYDAGTIRHLESLGVSSGWRCLEVGGGGGSIAAWLAARVGPTGHVVVTDIDPRYLESLRLPNLEVRRHNVAADPLPEAAFDLVHGRLVLMHIPEREAALARMVSALKPGGWILEEEFDSAVFPDPVLNPGEILSKTHLAMTRMMDESGVNRTFGRSLFGRLRALGLVNVAAEGRTFMWSSGSAGPSLLQANYEQLRTGMIDRGYLTEQEFDQDIAALQDPGFVMPSPVLWGAWGSRL
jgi:SAM-dependent methyltransferase